MSDVTRGSLERMGYGRLGAAIRHRMVERVSTYFPDLLAGSVSVQVAPERHLSTNSSHFKCVIRGQTSEGSWVQRCAFAKRSPLVEVEYTNLVCLWDGHYCRDNVNRIPRPLDCWPQWNLLLTEYIPNQIALLPWLARYVSPLGAFMNSRAATMRMQRVADWLIAFQMAASSSRLEAPAGSDIDEAYDDLSATACIPLASRRRIEEWLSSARGVFARTQPGLSHGDFAARNILLGQNTVTVVDWEKPLLVRHPLYDVQTFVVNLERRLSYPFSSQHRVEELKEAFLTHYLAQVPNEVDYSQLATTRVVALIHQLKAQYQALGGSPIEAAVKRRGPFVRYLLTEIVKETGIG